MVTTTHTAGLQGIGQFEFSKIIGFAVDCLVLSPVYGYYEQTWIQKKKDDLADSSVLSVLYALISLLATSRTAAVVTI